jgi:hypothetical protein
MRILDARGDGDFVKVQAREIARIGCIAKAQIHTICSVIHCGFQGGKAACGANQFQGFRSWIWRMVRDIHIQKNATKLERVKLSAPLPRSDDVDQENS